MKGKYKVEYSTQGNRRSAFPSCSMGTFTNAGKVLSYSTPTGFSQAYRAVLAVIDSQAS